MTELSVDYLKAFHRFVKGHAMIYDQIKAEVHKRARGSAGGTAKAKRALEGGGDDMELEDMTELLEGESPVKVTNAAPLSGFLAETDDYIDTSVVIAREGVFTGTDSQPRFKPYDALAESSKWFLGTPITNGHIPGEVQPETRRIGQIINVHPRPDTRDVFGTARFFKNHLNEEELTRLRSGSPIDGSIGYKTPVKYETGKFNDADYVGIETGPFILDEYAILPGSKGACSSEMGCGIFQNAAPGGTGGPFQNAKGKKKDPIEELMQAPPSLELDRNGNVRKRDCPKRKNEADKMTEEIEALKADFAKQLNAANETIGTLTKTVSELTTKLDGLTNETKSLNAAWEKKATDETTAKDAANKTAFGKILNAAAATEIDTLWSVVKDMNPMQYEGWKFTNSSKLLTEAEKKAATGKKFTDAAGDLVATARAKADAAIFKRR